MPSGGKEEARTKYRMCVTLEAGNWRLDGNYG
jgi:hypothetical protein